MPSNQDDNASRKRDNSPSRQNRQQSITSEENRSREENSNTSNYLMKNKEELLQRFGYLKYTGNRRVPRFYHVNNNQTLLIILQGDIVKTKVDAIVNAANEHMTGGSGVDGIIHHAAGDKLYDACKAHKQIYRGVRLPTGHSRILLSYNMSSTTYYIINTAGPVYNRSRAAECAKDLTSCYETALALAKLYDLESIGFTAISCGIFGYPANDGADVALRTVDKEAGSVPVVVFVLWDDHIYDAWIKKAKELNFSLFDPESPTTPTSPKPSADEDEVKVNKNPPGNNNDQESTTTFNPTVRDISTPDGNTGHLTENPPSVSTEPSDTQPIEPMESEEIHRSNTIEMKTDDSGVEKSITDDNSEPQSTREETAKIDDPKPPTNQNETDKSNEEKSTPNKVHDYSTGAYNADH